MLNAIPYLGKGSTPSDRLQGEYFTTTLTEAYQFTGRTVTTDNWFTSIPLVDKLQEKGLHLVGTCGVKKELPAELLKMKIANKESLAVYNHARDLTLQCTQVKPTKRLQLLSTIHHEPTIIEGHKTDIVMFYNATKGGVDTFDQLCAATDTAARPTDGQSACFKE